MIFCGKDEGNPEGMQFDKIEECDGSSENNSTKPVSKLHWGMAKILVSVCSFR